MRTQGGKKISLEGRCQSGIGHGEADGGSRPIERDDRTAMVEGDSGPCRKGAAAS